MSTTELVIGAGLPTNKAEIEVYNANVKDLALSGDVDIIKLARTVNVMKRIVENFEKETEIQNALLNEVQKYGKGELPEIQVKEVGTRWDFSECNYPQYERICQQIDLLTEQKKSLETYLKTIKRPTDFIDPETAEQVEIIPATKSSSTKVVFTLK